MQNLKENKMIFLKKGGMASLKTDFLSGLTVALALVPEAVAFSFVAGVEPLVGLYAAFIVGLITSIFGGRPGMISGATGALAVVMVALVSDHGVEYLFATVLLMGFLQIGAGALRLGKFVRLIPAPVMIGFVNGLAIVIGMAQFSQFKYKDSLGQMNWLPQDQLLIMGGLVLLTMGIIHFFPKVTKAVPSTLVAIVSVTLLVIFTGIDTRTVADMASIKGGLPSFHIPNVPFSLETLGIIFPYALILASIGLIESLMTLQLVDDITETRGRTNKECVGQGLSNVLCGIFGAMGGCAMIGQSMINVNSGGRGRASGITAALALLFFIVVASSLIEMIPIAALVGVMFMVVIGTFEWMSLKLFKKIPKADMINIILVTSLTVVFDLAVAVFAGVIYAALQFAWMKSTRIFAQNFEDEEGKKHYEITGPLFFGSVQSFNGMFDPNNDPKEIVMDFKNSKVCDYSSIESINTIVDKYKKRNKIVYIKNLSPDCQSVIKKAGNLFEAKVIQ